MVDWKHLPRDFKRKRAVARHVAAHGDKYSAYGFDLTVPATVDANVRFLLAKGRPYEAEEAHFITTHLSEGSNVIEVGGSIGVISRLIRSKIGQDAQHIVVEANPDLAAVCGPNATQGVAEGKTEILQAAVAYTNAKSVAFSRGITHHSGHVAHAGEKDTFEAPVCRLADLVAKLPKDNWALIADIEGGEYDMFMQEPPQTFARTTLAVIEIHPDAFALQGGDVPTFMARLDTLGFKVLDQQQDVILFSGPAGIA